MLDIRTEIDLSGVYSMVETFEFGIDDAERFAINKIHEVVRRDVLGISVRNLCSQAGPGWPDVYTEHLVAFMQLKTNVNAVSYGSGIIEVTVDFDNLGGYEELFTGWHHQAIEDFDLAQTGAKGGTKAVLNPPKVDLPYIDQELYVRKGAETAGRDQEIRQEFWEQAIVGQMPFLTNFPRGKNGYLMVPPGPTYEQVAAARVDNWIAMGVAPEWVLLENGYTESEPEIFSVDFSDSLETIINCVATSIYEGALVTLINIAEEAGEAISIVGGSAPRSRSTGRFVKYREVLDQSVPDYSGCLGRF